MSGADTIYALSSGKGRAGVAVIRVSGAGAGACLAKLTGRSKITPRHATFTPLFTQGHKQVLDHALVLFFPAPASFTGEDVAELQVHGGKAVVESVMAALSSLGCRMAEAGEFTRRAFLNEKLDLAQAEGLADLIDAETEAQRKQALAQMQGGFSRAVEAWRDALLRILAHIEADIDFPDEDLPAHLAQKRFQDLSALHADISVHLAAAQRGERLRDGFQIALLGAPNAGKSSLLNALAERDAAIVSARAGTTRDIIEVHMNIGGYPVILVDTAGLRETEDEIEEEGMRRALARASDADLKIVLFDATALPQLDAPSLALVDEKTFVVLNKMDAFGASPIGTGTAATYAAPSGVDTYLRGIDAPYCLSAKNNIGLPALLGGIQKALQAWVEEGPPVLATRARHREALAHTATHLARALDAVRTQKPLELVAEDIRLAARALGRITGRVDVEALLDIIFRDFCIGK